LLNEGRRDTAGILVEVTAAAPRNSAPALGLVTMLQLLPFQCSVRVWGVLAASWNWPTAHTSFADTAVTALSRLDPVPLFGLGTTAQLLPFQCSINV
jgi:membrane-associated phospholipid phosphatase